MDGFIILIQLFGMAYALSLGMGLITARRRGATYVNRWWLRTLRALVRGTLRLISDFFRWAAKQI